jgi:hypothetical protein
MPRTPPPVTAEDLIDAPGISERAGIHPDHIETWPEGRDEFPPPVAQLTIGKVWAWPDVESWIGPAVR